MMKRLLRERRIEGYLALWTVLVHSLSLRIPFDWETIRFFVQPRPGRFRFREALFGSWIDLSDYGITVASLTLRPLMAWLFQLEALLFGSWAPGYHLINLAMHILCVILLYRFAKRLNLTVTGAATAALLFASHPLGTQPLWILGDRAEQFVLAGGLLALLYYRRRPGISMMGLILALYSKETAVTIPAWIFVMDFLYERNRPAPLLDVKGIIRRQWIYWAITLIYLVHRTLALGGMGGYRSVEHFRFDHVTDVLVQNLAWIFTLPHGSGWLLIPGCLLILPIFLPHAPPALRFSIAWGLIFLLPVHNLCNKWYLYIPLAAAALYAGTVLSRFDRSPKLRPHRITGVLILSAILSYMSFAELTHQKRNGDVPVAITTQTAERFPVLPAGASLAYFIQEGPSPDDLAGHFFRRKSFVVSARKHPVDAIVWDLNGTRYMPSGIPVWTRSVEAFLRLHYDDMILKAGLTGKEEAGSSPYRIALHYDPVSGILTVP